MLYSQLTHATIKTTLSETIFKKISYLFIIAGTLVKILKSNN